MQRPPGRGAFDPPYAPFFQAAAELIRFDRGGRKEEREKREIYCTACERASAPAFGACVMEHLRTSFTVVLL